ncbi:histidine phosphatase superfamily [Scheffersomyces xylosifermentans]|uniref:histidine phosphatase superfamily n=1 Tax=Scheffersomyces xylosifermentans TaxID=1304137 RepID=UPI00315D7D48
MSELYFFRHGQRIDHALDKDPLAKPLTPDYNVYDPSLSEAAINQMENVAEEIISTTNAFPESPSETTNRKNVFIHFSPYLRCCQTADLLVTELKLLLPERFPNYKIRYQLLCDFALSEWIHDKMRNKPPFVDSNDAYNMYTPNLKLLKNRSNCSNFRPTTTLGPYNGPDLSFSDYKSRCKDYFKRLLATYEKASYIKNKDIIIVISHGYAINNFLSYFINHPIFDEIPEAAINMAKRVHIDEDFRDTDDSEDGSEGEDEVLDPEDYTWRLTVDSMGIIENNIHEDTTLNLETDIVYYKTNFIKRDELDAESGAFTRSAADRPRASFKIEPSSSDTSTNSGKKTNYYTICPSAKNWDSKAANKFKIKAEFQKKVMNDESFKKSFSIGNHPSKPVSPEISPNSEPTRNNSVVDLSKLLDNDEIYKPIKLKYSTTSEIPVHKLNSKVNSQLNLSQMQREMYASSNDNSSVDLVKYISNLQTRKRSVSSPAVRDSYFPISAMLMSEKLKNSGSEMSLDSLDELDAPKDLRELPILSSSPVESITRARSQNSLSRGRSLNNKKGRAIMAKFNKASNTIESDESDDSQQKVFSLAFSNHQSLHRKPSTKSSSRAQTTSPVATATRSRRNSIKFIPSVVSYERVNFDSLVRPTETSETTTELKRNGSKNGKSEIPAKAQIRPVFYNLDSESDAHSDLSDEGSNVSDNEKVESDKKEQYLWFGSNRS